jgi:mxaC protein
VNAAATLASLAWTEPRWLWLLPLALLPLLPRATAASRVPHLAWLPHDRAGQVAEAVMRLVAATTIALTVVALAGPERPESGVARTGRGAEIALLLDRSSSMDDVIRHNGRDVVNLMNETKAQSMRRVFVDFVSRRPHDRYALVLFANSALRVLPFTEDVQAVRAGIGASGIGRGLVETDIGRALLAGIDAFRDRAYTGSRVIVLVSDGGAVIDPPTQARIHEGLVRERITLYFIYIRSSTNSPDLDQAEVGPIEASTPEWVLHNWFKSLPTPYRVFQAKDPASIGAAVAALDRQQNLPLIDEERIPRVDLRGPALAAALGSALLLLLLRSLVLAPGRAASRRAAGIAP